MILSGIMGAARREIVPFLVLGTAFLQCETGEFEGITRRFSQQKYDDSRRQESIDKKQEEEETRKAQADKMKQKQEYLSRKVVKIPENTMLLKKS